MPHNNAHVRRRWVRWGAIPAVVGAVALAATITGSQAHAVGEVGISVYTVEDRQLVFGVCLFTLDLLPARIEGSYSVSSGGAPPVASGPLSDGDPGGAITDMGTCPDTYLVFSTQALVPGTEYVITAAVTITPREEIEDGSYVDDLDRSSLSASATSTVTTTSEGVVDAGASSGGDEGSGGASSGGGTTGDSSGGSAGGSGSSGSTGTPTPPVIIPTPEQFRPAQLAALTPAQVATIAPSDFGQLLPATFKALKPAQAAEVTPEQASVIRPARAAELRPATVAALDPQAIAALRPAAVKFLSPEAIKAMTPAQLRALTPRQVAALRPLQLAELTVAKKALLRRR